MRKTKSESRPYGRPDRKVMGARIRKMLAAAKKTKTKNEDR